MNHCTSFIHTSSDCFDDNQSSNEVDTKSIRLASASVVWEIEDFLSLSNCGRAKWTAVMLPPETLFYLYCIPCVPMDPLVECLNAGKNDQNSLTEIRLQLSAKSAPILVRIRLALVNTLDHDNNYNYKEQCAVQEKIDFFNPNSYGGFYHIRHDYLANPANHLVVDGKLTIKCEIKELSRRDVRLGPLVKECIAQTLRDFNSALNLGEYSDFTLVAEGVKFPVHKAILAARSSVFKAMFREVFPNDSKPQQFVLEPNISARTCQQMLQFIYAARVPDDSGKNVLELMQLANQFQLHDLEQISTNFAGTSEALTTERLVAQVQAKLAHLLKHRSGEDDGNDAMKRSSRSLDFDCATNRNKTTKDDGSSQSEDEAILLKH